MREAVAVSMCAVHGARCDLSDPSPPPPSPHRPTLFSLPTLTLPPNPLLTAHPHLTSPPSSPRHLPSPHLTAILSSPPALIGRSIGAHSGWAARSLQNAFCSMLASLSSARRHTGLGAPGTRRNAHAHTRNRMRTHHLIIHGACSLMDGRYEPGRAARAQRGDEDGEWVCGILGWPLMCEHV